jgi:hypothetical protein
MQVSSEAREVSDLFIFSLIKQETKLYTQLDHLMGLKVKVGQKLMTIGANMANIKKCLAQCEMLDNTMAPLLKQHQKVVDHLKAYGIVVNRS